MSGFVKDREVLEEGYKVNDLLDFSKEVHRLENLAKGVPYSSIIGYVGKFGSGKSTIIYQLQKLYKESKDTQWFEFDAWKYPERKDLWEGFVLDVADQLGKRKKLQKKIDGHSNTAETVGAVAQIAQSLSIIPGLSFAVEKFSHLFKTHPIERVFEIQELLREMFLSLKEETIFIVIEDVDRSGDAGRFFLETLRQFIKNNVPEKRIVVLVPIGTEVYDNNEEHRASFQKVLDYILFFEPQNIGFSSFIKEVFEPSVFPEETEVQTNVKEVTQWQGQIDDWFKIASANGLTIREIKVVLRFANVAYQDLLSQDLNPDPRIVMAFSLLNHVFDGGVRWITRISKNVNVGCPIKNFLEEIPRNCNHESFEKKGFIRAQGINLVKNVDITIPKNISRDGKQIVYELADFYLLPFGKGSF